LRAKWKWKKAPESPKGGSKSDPGAREKRVMFDLFNKKDNHERRKCNDTHGLLGLKRTTPVTAYDLTLGIK
jgi:hypothetical protein